MANYTQKAILQTFEDMLREMRFDKITVSALVARCEISSNTFYYHFRDIYDLLDAWIGKVKQEFLEDTAEIGDWAEKLKLVLHLMQDNSKLVFNLFDSISRERLERFAFSSVRNLFYEEVSREAEGKMIPDEVIRGVSDFCCYSILGYLLEFLWNRMEADVDKEVDRLNMIFAGAIEYVIRKSMSGKPEESAREEQ